MDDSGVWQAVAAMLCGFLASIVHDLVGCDLINRKIKNSQEI
jgi:hypothetical protein